MTLLEPDVTLTDYLLAIEASAFAWILARSSTGPGRLAQKFVMLFTAIAVASLLGGTIHGFVPERHPWYPALWSMTLITLGVSAFAAWLISADLMVGLATSRIFTWIALLQLIAYVLFVVVVRSDFVVGIINYLLAISFLTVCFAVRWFRTRSLHVAVGLAGFGLTFLAAWIQHSRIALYPPFVDHNAFYHLVQAIALGMIFYSAKSIVKTSLGAMNDHTS